MNYFPSQRKTKFLLLPLLLLLLLLATFLFVAPRLFRPLPSDSSNETPAPTPKDLEPLQEVMRNQVHTEYTTLSFTIWHDRPLTPAKFTTIATSSRRLKQLSQDLNPYVSLFQQQGWGERDARFFGEKRLQLGQVATELERAAVKHDGTQVTSFFLYLETTCHSCHKRFRPDLS
jgi:hypothetical protein